ncbi:hypothetical protein FVE85_0626 [Porphyridium purpureum]|uniref:Uncharacterized protein n=1 Tax=Porphyridium purpureum TaxID=35688 RepID=A0A5J4Z2K3_PORPP|nr:hypothetical protein FVE85_0626 [Porphyridium purpureum]|eukprot:POR7403..scf208_2
MAPQWLVGMLSQQQRSPKNSWGKGPFDPYSSKFCQRPVPQTLIFQRYAWDIVCPCQTRCRKSNACYMSMQTDILFLYDFSITWDLFDSWKPDMLLGMSSERSDNVIDNLNYCNADVAIMNLQGLRSVGLLA